MTRPVGGGNKEASIWIHLERKVKLLQDGSCLEPPIKDLGSFPFFYLNVFSITGQKLESHSLFFFMQQSFLLSIHVKDLHTNTHLSDRAKFKLVFIHTRNPPCHTHTYKAYLGIICFKLCIMTLESELTTEQATVMDLTK